MTSDVVAVRQNLDLLVDGGKPVSRAQRQRHEQVGLTRSAIRSTSGDPASALLPTVRWSMWVGPGLNITTLAKLLVRAGAVRGMELDINTDWVILALTTQVLLCSRGRSKWVLALVQYDWHDSALLRVRGGPATSSLCPHRGNGRLRRWEKSCRGCTLHLARSSVAALRGARRSGETNTQRETYARRSRPHLSSTVRPRRALPFALLGPRRDLGNG